MTLRPRRLLPGLLLLAAASCSPPAPEPQAPGSFAFAVFGDGPYYPGEQGRWRRLLRDVGRADVQWLLHVGDLFWYPCSDEAYRRRRAELDALPLPVVYTPGDNEWTDCHGAQPGRYEPLGRLASIRRTFFRDPGRSLGGRPMRVRSQAEDPAFAAFPENVRWTRGGFVFATLHLVGSANGREGFPGRTAAHDAEVERRTAAAVVLATHANLGIGEGPEERMGYEAVIERLERNVAGFPGAVLLVHGDTHTRRVDHPLRDRRGRAYPNFTRLETYGSPQIGWVRVVVDTAAGRVVKFEPRLVR